MYSSVLEFGYIHCCKQGLQCKIKKRMANSEDPDEMARYLLVMIYTAKIYVLVCRAERVNSP